MAGVVDAAQMTPEQAEELARRINEWYDDIERRHSLSDILPTLVRIANKDNQEIPFEPWTSQERFIKWFLYCYFQEGKWELIMPKLRQGGLTLVGLATCLLLCLLYDNLNVTFLIKNGEDCEPLFDRLREMYQSLPHGFRRDLNRSQARAIKFAHNNSSIRILEAGQSKTVTAKKGRSSKNTIAWVTEAAYIEHAAELARGLRGSVTPNGVIVWESTMDGPGNRFGRSLLEMHKDDHYVEPNVWMKGRKVMLFLPMYENPEYVASVGSNWKPISDREEQLLRVCNSPEHVMFRRREIEAHVDDAKTGLTAEEAVDREYPFELMDGLLESGRDYFHTDVIRGLIAYWKAKKPTCEEFGIMRVPGKGVAWVAPTVKNTVKVWKMPEKGWKHRYVYIADCGEGTLTSDPDAGYMFDLVAKEVVAATYGRQGADIQAEQAMCLGEMYNNAWIVWDRSGVGADRLPFFLSARYPALFSKRPVDDVLIEPDWTGVKWNGYNRTAALGVVRHCIESQDWTCPDLELFNEILSFGYDDKFKKAQGQGGTPDDRVMALALLGDVIYLLPQPVQEVKVSRGQNYESNLQKRLKRSLQPREDAVIGSNYD